MPIQNRSSNSYQTSGHSILWPQLTKGTLLRRYKRFLADIMLDSGETVTAHCPNSGAMKECNLPGQPVYLTHHDSPKRKLKYTWELIEMPDSLVGVNTLWPNKLVSLAITTGKISELSGYTDLRHEVKVGSHSRLDILLMNPPKQFCYVEVKNCTMVTNGIASFPDAITTRGLKHLVELQKLLGPSVRCVMVYLIQRMDAKLFSPADEIDKNYGKELRKAFRHGVEILAYDVNIDLTSIGVNKPISIKL